MDEDQIGPIGLGSRSPPGFGFSGIRQSYVRNMPVILQLFFEKIAVILYPATRQTGAYKSHGFHKPTLHANQ
jgi:hypothetical protein